MLPIYDIFNMNNQARLEYVCKITEKIRIELINKGVMYFSADELSDELYNFFKKEYANISIADLTNIKIKINALPDPNTCYNGEDAFWMVAWQSLFGYFIKEQLEIKQNLDMVSKLHAICTAHKEIMENSFPILHTGCEVSDTAKRSKEKINVLNRFINILQSDNPPEKIIENFKKDYDDSKGVFIQGNDSVGILFINAIACVFSNGIKAAYSMWKEGIKALKHTRQIDELVSNPPSTRAMD